MIKTSMILLATIFTFSFSFSGVAFADDKKTVGEKVESGYEKSKDAVAETYDDAKKGTKKAYREVKDKTCEMINGKLECATKKVTHKAKNVGDEVKDKVN